jgi:hypothetical protein
MPELSNEETAALHFENCRRPKTLDDLSPLEREQLTLAGKLYDGQELSAAERLGFGDVDEESALQFLSVWDLIDLSGIVKFTAWFYMVDTGTVFRANSLEIVAEVIQCGLECENQELAGQIFAALDQLKKTYPDDAKSVNIIPNEM